jgi:hypothetical protein
VAHLIYIQSAELPLKKCLRHVEVVVLPGMYQGLSNTVWSM